MTDDTKSPDERIALALERIAEAHETIADSLDDLADSSRELREFYEEISFEDTSGVIPRRYLRVYTTTN